MNIQEIEKKILGLREEIIRNEELYRIKNSPEISDAQFDSLMAELKKLEAKFPQFYNPNSPSLNIGKDYSNDFDSVAHLSPMLSLDNVVNKEDFNDFDNRIKRILELDLSQDLNYVIEPKIDGCGVSAIYENGKLTRILSRGDGTQGDDITRNASFIKNLPYVLKSDKYPIPTLLEIRGEAYMENEEFDRICTLQKEFEENKILKKRKKLDGKVENNSIEFSEKDLILIQKKIPSNPRNLTAGTLKLVPSSMKKNPISKMRELKVIFYSVATIKGFNISVQSSIYGILRDWGLPSFDTPTFASGSFELMDKIFDLKKSKSLLPYNIDGAVIKLDDISLHSSLGNTTNAPRWAVAWKYNPNKAESSINEIVLQVGRTGVITPVANLKLIENLSGTKVSRATLHNMNNIIEKDIRIGDTVVVEKAGEIIPEILYVIKEKRPANSKAFEIPEFCPECGSKLSSYEDKILLKCENFSCPPQVVGRIAHFASKECMDIEGLGDKVAKILVTHLNIKSPLDLYTLTKDQLLGTDIFRERGATRLLKSIENSKNRDLWRLIYGLGIPEIGKSFAQSLANEFGDLDILKSADIAQINAIEPFGASYASKNEGYIRESVRVMSVVSFFKNQMNLDLIEGLKASGVNFKIHTNSSTPSKQTSFTAKSFVLTGAFRSMTRSMATTLIECFGGKVMSAVSLKTDFLITDGKINGSKAKKAKLLNIPILTEGDFLLMIKNSQAA